MGKTILITGANGNLGSAAIKIFLENGWNVIGTIRKASEKASLKSHPLLDLRVVDLMEEKSVNELIENLILQYKNINAGIFTVGGFAMGNFNNTGFSEIQKQFDLNFKTAYHTCRPLLLHMIKNNEGRIVFIGSRPALEPKRAGKVIPYALSKSLLFTLSSLINAETEKLNVTSTVIVPDVIDTPENRSDMPDANTSHWVAPERIAEIMEFITRDAAKPLRENVLKVYG